ncbi:MAG: UDP-N-acetylglucosamine--N-acetylmuramyl-(pentapeptide) pyrophosphoryl-undecaprenol N-acetylglucosamine transferase [Phycisphaerae bacterium]|nr:UDP-N-acetylglucosamine--N-acetylmuramyl-(pentapeptide) pyrophosphoryl-undecaprenol N-acetylglucosamine transferase [Phycisphaerae bacterium]
MTGPTVLFAGGGSGGHISPALAIAEAVQSIDPEATCLFACSDRPIDAAMLEQAERIGYPLPARPPSLKPARMLGFARSFSKSRRMAAELIQAREVDVTVLLGGFVAAPVASACRRTKTPSLMVNLDRVPGRANMWIRPSASTVVSAVTTVKPFATQITGMPIRHAAMPPGTPAACRRQLGLDPDRPTLLITGASQGAGTINALMPYIAEQHSAALDRWQILHLAGPAAADEARSAWHRSAIEATVLGFRHDMGVVWGSGDLVISRSGACSVAEIEYAGLPAIYLPYPHHRDNHQQHNAAPAVEAGAAVIVTDTTDTARTAHALLDVAGALLAAESPLEAMQTAAAARSGRDSAGDLARLAIGLIGSQGP